MPVLMLNNEVLARIGAAVAHARAHPVPLSVLRTGAVPHTKPVISLADRKPGYERPLSEHVLIPIGYRAAVSVEEQPTGMYMHLSISVDRAGKMPSPQAVIAIAAAFGIKWPPVKDGAAWVEEFEPGQHAFNIIQPLGVQTHGTA
jgi:hypothetical protein